MTLTQHTIQREFSLQGKGLHTGQFITATISPAPAGHGIRFVRTDKPADPPIPADARLAGDCTRCSVLTRGDSSIFTLEHLMSALHGMQIDNAAISLDGPELPILDGSAKPWMEGIHLSGLMDQKEPRQMFIPSRPIEFRSESGASYKMTPADKFSVDCEIEFQSDLIGRQQAHFESGDDYGSEIAPCRTFVFLHEVMPLLRMGLIKGGDIENALVFAERPISNDDKLQLAEIFGKDPADIQIRNGLLNTNQQYFPNEPARHKLLDFMGDILLFGRPIAAHFDIRCPGHKSNLQFAQYLQQQFL